MRPLLLAIPIACVAFAVTGAIVGETLWVILGLLVGVGSYGLLSARHVQGSANRYAALSAEAASLSFPVTKLVREIKKIVADNAASPTIQILGKQVISEAEVLEEQVIKTLASRDAWKRALKGQYEAEKAIGSARSRLEFAGELERAGLNSVIDARAAELKHFDHVQTRINRVEVSVIQAEAALAEMKARLAVSVSAGQEEADPSADLREAITRLKTLSDSYQESFEIVKGS
jgi:hypothetical protein